jgi:hypothetical protein
MNLLLSVLVLPSLAPGGLREIPARHDASVSTSRLEVRGAEVSVTIRLSLEDLAMLVPAGELDPENSGWLTPERFRRLLPRLFEYQKTRFRLSSRGQPLRAELRGGTFPGEEPIPLSGLGSIVAIETRYWFPSTLRGIQVHCEVLQEGPLDHRHLAEFSDGQMFAFDRIRRDSEWSARPSGLEILGEIGFLGVKYALGAGWGFLAFSLALGGTAATLRSGAGRAAALFLGSATAFLGSLSGGLHLPPDIIRIGVIGSVGYLAAESALAPRAPARWLLSAGLGSFHGMDMERFLRSSEPAAPLAWGGLFLLGLALGQAVLLGLLVLGSGRLRRDARKRWREGLGSLLCRIPGAAPALEPRAESLS